MKITVYNQEGKESGTLELPKAVFEIPLNADLIHQVMVAQAANRRQVSAHTKNRGEVSGGGRKPWVQKHTGRARHGSIRSPLWKGGGVTFGPRKDRVFAKRLNKGMRRKALLSVLSEKARRKQIIVLEGLEFAKPKTKEMDALLRKLPCERRSTLLALDKQDQQVVRATRNLSYAFPMQARELSVLDVLSAEYLVFTKEAVKQVEEVFV